MRTSTSREDTDKFGTGQNDKVQSTLTPERGDVTEETEGPILLPGESVTRPALRDGNIEVSKCSLGSQSPLHSAIAPGAFPVNYLGAVATQTRP